MRTTKWSTVAALFGLAVACVPEKAVDPTFLRPNLDEPHAAVVPASSYTAYVWKPQGGFRDVNGRNLIVGTADGNAVAMILGGPLTTLSNGPGIGSKAEAVNARGEIVGSVDVGTVQQPLNRPAYWRRPGLPPILLPDTGEAADINDHGFVVGTVTAQGTGRAYVWQPNNGLLDWLPTLPGGSVTVAVAINNDHIILGYSDANGGIGGGTVLWQHNGASWVVQQVTSSASDIVGYDIDSGYGIVGHTMQVASFGDPYHAGYFNVSSVGRSYATAVTGSGVVTGWDEGVLPPGVLPSYGFGTAFIADRFGATSYLPFPAGNWTASAGHGLNDCGLVVGELWTQGAWHPAVWDPGC